MLTGKKMAIVLISGLLLGAAGQQGLAADTSAAPANRVAITGDDGKSLAGLLAILTESTAHAAQKSCTPDQLYSQHDVVGDPDACFRNHYDVRGSLGGSVSVPGF